MSNTNKNNVIQTDWETYVGPALELIYERSSMQLRSIWSEVEEIFSIAKPVKNIGDWQNPYLFIPNKKSDYGKYEQSTLLPDGLTFPSSTNHLSEKDIYQDNAIGRLKEMNKLGIDCHIMHPCHTVNASINLSEAIAIGLIEAYNLYIDNFCSVNPKRLKAILQLYGSNPYWSSTELDRYLSKESIAGVSILMPALISPDHQEFDVLWRAISKSKFPLIFKKGQMARHWSLKRIMFTLLRNDMFRKFELKNIILIGYTKDEYRNLSKMISENNWLDRITKSNIQIAIRENWLHSKSSLKEDNNLFGFSTLKTTGFPFVTKPV